MKHYAIGKKGGEIRIIVQSPDETIPRLNRLAGEVYLEIEAPGLRGQIAKDGRSIVPVGVDWADERWRIREERTARLNATDYLMASDYPVAADQREALAGYRQALRDILGDQPDTAFADIVWPDKPAI